MLKIGKDLVNKEYVLVIPNQVTIVFDFDFTKIKLITKQGIKEIPIDSKKTKFRIHSNAQIKFTDTYGKQFIFQSGSYRYNLNNYLTLNHNYIKKIVELLLDNVPFDFNSYQHEENPAAIKDVKCYPSRIVITYDNDLGKIIKNSEGIGEYLNTWQYYFYLRNKLHGSV